MCFLWNPHINQLLNTIAICLKIYAKFDGMEERLKTLKDVIWHMLISAELLFLWSQF